METLGGAIECVGNRTECALLVMLRDWGEDYKALRTAHGDRVVEVYGFSSERKMASVLVRRDDGGLRLYNKVGSSHKSCACPQWKASAGMDTLIHVG